MKKVVCNLTVEAAVANQGGAMEVDTISKNERSSKSQACREKVFKIACFVLLAIFSSTALQAQDIITLRNGEDIMAKVYEIGSTEIKYKRFDNLQGPTYTIEKIRIFMITYENGIREVFANETTIQSHTQKHQQPTPGYIPKSPALAWFCSFLLPGVGQFYNGDAGKGVLFLLGNIAGYSIVYVSDEGSGPLGAILVLVTWIGAQIDAPSSAKRKNREHGYFSWNLCNSDATLALYPDFKLYPISGNPIMPTYGLGLKLKF